MYEHAELAKRMRQLYNDLSCADCMFQNDCQQIPECYYLRAAEAIESADEPRWISVNDRLPEKFESVWAACKMEGRDNWVIEVPNYGISYYKNPWGKIPLLEDGAMEVYSWLPNLEPDPPEEPLC